RRAAPSGERPRRVTFHGGSTAMMKSFRVKLDERVVVFKDGLPYRALGPGSHTIWGFSLGERRWSTETLVFQAPPEVRAIMPERWYGEVSLSPEQRGILYRDARPVMFLRPGTHRYWKADDSVHVEIFSVTERMPPLTAELAALVPRDEYVDVTVREHER